MAKLESAVLNRQVLEQFKADVESVTPEEEAFNWATIVDAAAVHGTDVLENPTRGDFGLVKSALEVEDLETVAKLRERFAKNPRYVVGGPDGQSATPYWTEAEHQKVLGGLDAIEAFLEDKEH